MAYTLITGASSGIGAEFARELAKKGHHLILVARSENELVRLSDEIRQQQKIQIQVIPHDLSQVASAESLFKKCQDLNLEVNVLINCAGIGLFDAFDSEDLGKIQEMILLNILTLTKLTHLFLPQLKQNKGRILNVASTAAFQPVPDMACYAATKAYVLSLSEAINAELKNTGVTVTTLAPGPIRTKFFEAAGTSIEKNRMKKLTPEEVVQAGIEGLEKRKSLVIPNWINRFIVFSIRLAPRSWVLKVSQYFIGY